MLTGTGAQAGLARPADGPVPPGRVVRPPTMPVPSGSVGSSADARGQAPAEARAAGGELAPVGRSTAAAVEVRAEGADPVASPETVGDAVVGAPPAVPLPATSPRPDGSLPGAAVRGARLRPSATPLPATRAAEGRDERPVLQRRGEPPPAGSAPPPAARTRTPPGEPPPPSAGRPPPRSEGSAAGSGTGRSPATGPPPSARSGPPPRSSGPPPAPARRRPPGRPPVG